MKLTHLFTAVLAALLLLNLSAVAQDPAITLANQSIDSAFRDHITATLSAQAAAGIENVEFFYRVKGQRATSRNVADFEPGNQIEATYRLDQTDVYFPPGTELQYWWKVTDANGDELKTETQTFRYLDDRHDFESLSNDRLTLYWYRGADSFGQALYDQANKGLDQLEQNVGVNIEDPIQIFIYGSHDDLMSSLSVGAQEWTGGVAFTEQGTVVLGVSPANLDWGLKAMTHEMTHLVIHQATDNPYGDLPRWLDEGLAVYNEDPERLDSQFRGSFQSAVQNDSLMTLQTLSSTFPADSQAANLAYGQSGAVVKYIIDTYGAEKMKTLLDIFAEGELYDKALMQALGVDTSALNNEWRISLGLPPLDAPAAPTATVETTDAVESLPTATPQAVSEEPATDATPPPALPTPVNDHDHDEDSPPCLIGFIPLVFMGVVLTALRVRKK